MMALCVLHPLELVPLPSMPVMMGSLSVKDGEREHVRNLGCGREMHQCVNPTIKATSSEYNSINGRVAGKLKSNIIILVTDRI